MNKSIRKPDRSIDRPRDGKRDPRVKSRDADIRAARKAKRDAQER